jgi:hypothetical protein
VIEQMENSTIKLLKLPLFDGTAAKFQIWWVRFKAFASCSRFSKALGDTMEMAMPVTEAATIAVTDDSALNKKAKERNQLAFAQLTMAFTTESAMTFIYESMTDPDWPSGLAYLVVKTLKRKYIPEDTIFEVELRRMMNGIKMKKGSDPVELFNQISAVKVRYERPGNTIDENELIAIVISVAPSTYQGVLTSEQMRQGNSLRLARQDQSTAANIRWITELVGARLMMCLRSVATLEVAYSTGASKFRIWEFSSLTM